MLYMLMIHEDESKRPTEPAAQAELMQEYMKFHESITQSGHFRAGHPFQPAATARTVKVRDGSTSNEKGPFVKSDEPIGGYYLIDAKSEDEAVEIATRIPSATYGAVEIRPIMNLDM